MSEVKSWVAKVDGKEQTVSVESLGEGKFRVRVGEKVRELEARRVEGSGWVLMEGGQVRRVDVDFDKNADPVVDLGSGVGAVVKLGALPG